jgi:two-component system, NarL family, sensor histidine kinase DesK
MTTRSSLGSRVVGAAALLSAAGIDVRVDAAVPALAPGTEPVLAWAVREGVTNVLRHSDASMCAITIAAADTAVRLEMVNDAAHASSDGGSGLAGLDDRARELSGTVTTERDDGRFRLVVQIPGEVP